MKTPHSLLSLLAALAMPVALQAQTPDQPRPDGPPPQKHGPDGAPHHGGDHKGGHAWHGFHHGPHGGPQGAGPAGGDQMDRAAHIKEAMNHLRAAGLGMMADHMEEMAKKFAEKGRGLGAPSGDKHSGPPPFSAPTPFGGPPSFGHGPQMHSAPQQQGGGIDELRQELRMLAGQVRELSAIVKGQHGGAPQYQRPGEANRGPHPEFRGHPPRPESRSEQPRGDQTPDERRRPEPPKDGERKADRPPGDDKPKGERAPL